MGTQMCAQLWGHNSLFFLLPEKSLADPIPLRKQWPDLNKLGASMHLGQYFSKFVAPKNPPNPHD